MGFTYWGDGNPLYISDIDTTTITYWGDAMPIIVLTLSGAITLFITWLCDDFPL
jgi:hypothetical protein